MFAPRAIGEKGLFTVNHCKIAKEKDVLESKWPVDLPYTFFSVLLSESVHIPLKYMQSPPNAKLVLKMKTESLAFVSYV